ncbi:hypothetical protein [Leisingera sp. M658]|uniref:hypothetical protein n=1 Tax=Leisingera sp. M658 TaxID=2867015 RepID=UPI0021A36FA2|nr:hypothetical protein [Leisingera sp. M658]UWQ76332.1 hypothetical protein K3724_07835 [Leisingera sp. M658]
MKLPVLAALFTLTFAAAAAAAPGAEETCKALAARSQGEGLSMNLCTCTYKLADEVMDDDIKALLFQSWNDGIDRQEEADALKPRGRASKQFRKLERAVRKKCAPF